MASPLLRKERSLLGHKGRVFDLRWSTAGPSRLASVGEKGGVVWSLDGGAATRTVSFAGTEFMRVCWHPGGAHVLVGDAQGKIAVRAADDGAVSATLDAHAEDEVYGLEVLSGDDGGLLAAAAGDTVQLWDLEKAERTAQVTLAATAGGVVFGGLGRNPEARSYVFGFAASGRLLSAALSDGTVRLVDARSLQVLASLGEHARRGAPAFATALSQTAPLLASSDGEGSVLLWDLRRLGHGPLAEVCAAAAVQAVAFVPGAAGGASELLATGGDDRTVCLHELVLHEGGLAPSGLHELATVSTATVLSPVLSIEAAPDATTPRLASGGGSGGLMSDASVSLWRMDGSAAKKREREPAEADEEEEGAAATATCLPCVAERVPCPKSRRDGECCDDGDD